MFACQTLRLSGIEKNTAMNRQPNGSDIILVNSKQHTFLKQISQSQLSGGG